MALAPDPADERRRQQRIEAATAPAPSRAEAARVAADFGLTVLEDGSYAKAQPNGKVGDALSVPAGPPRRKRSARRSAQGVSDVHRAGETHEDCIADVRRECDDKLEIHSACRALLEAVA
jgi:hypothetical protein